MTRNKLVLAATTALVGLSIIAGSAAYAGGSSRDDAAEVQQLLNAPVDISGAISAAEAATGGIAASAEFDITQAVAFFEVDTIAGDRVMSVKVDATSGAATETTDEGLVSALAADDDDYAGLAQLTAPLSDAVAMAEAHSGGKVMAIGLESEDGASPQIEIEIAKHDGSTQVYALDPASGLLTAIADAQGTGDDDDDEEEDDDD